jgi:hypothetical protein
MRGGQSKNTPLECMIKYFKRRFNRDYGFKLTPGKLRTFCWLDQFRRIVQKELTSFSPFCGKQDIRFPERRLGFARIPQVSTVIRTM